MTASHRPRLFEPLQIRGLELKNRVVISPMCQHSAEGRGRPGAWHLVHLSKFALGGAGLIFVESTAVDPGARIGVRDVGLWSDEQVAPFKAIVDFVHENGAAIGVQLAHAGRKAGSQALWEGGRALTMEQLHATGEPWRRVGPSAVAAGPEWSVPEALTPDGIAEIRQMFVAATERADRAGFDVVELHFGHGYLIASFLSPHSNRRDDEYGGSRENRMRLALEVARDVRARWPQEKPLFVRISAVDGTEDGWGLDDSVVLARELKAIGVDVFDCSSGGLSDETRNMNVPRGLGFQVPFSERIRREADVMTQAVGVILDGPQAEAILQEGRADLIAVGRQALYDPYWAHHAAHALGHDLRFEGWPTQHGPWLAKRAPLMEKLQSMDNSAGRLAGAGR
ncbi:2,4-dienoyl-CoA reductase-like NADH-dependent reductase (Old Yellow Enzyme family) [Microvirga flocculans]|uniref:2,4-dienoyl-CoA reductase-like NADH-dependent reductase (Old Yellow Enzyme family) n=1 Tax=Microvirga flocculans TaxID=217168 RepID=A0A7W6IHX4_9HYPH|nr:NADH:flavin oxidoreductase/NADH oxidase [Microvirga flocculans]MBB4041782.1 2,4-dienoyl-CoA reductase-like NADH-dependent reductase (Old Yellow Enzyme family) [Microvirga flocculans]